MAGHDDELDRRIHDLMGLAGSDAPEAQAAAQVGVRTTEPTTHRWAPWLAIAAMMITVVAAVTVLTRGDDDESATVVPVTTVPESTSATSPESSSSSTSASTSTSVAIPASCGDPGVANYDEQGSMHTLVESDEPIEVTIEPLDLPWCSGGTGRVHVTFENVGSSPASIDSPQVILNGGMNKYQIGSTIAVALDAGESVTVETTVTIHGVPPGTYSLQVYGFFTDTPVRIDGPAVCTDADLETEAGPTEGAMGNQSTIISVTNVGANPCLLAKPVNVVAWVGDDPANAVFVPFDTDTFFPVADPVPAKVLRPGEEAIVLLHTGSGCLDGTVTPTYWTHLRIGLQYSGSDPGVDVALGRFSTVQTACGLSLSGWASPQNP